MILVKRGELQQNQTVRINIPEQTKEKKPAEQVMIRVDSGNIAVKFAEMYDDYSDEIDLGGTTNMLVIPTINLNMQISEVMLRETGGSGAKYTVIALGGTERGRGMKISSGEIDMGVEWI